MIDEERCADIIAAISTPVGEGGIGIIRLSGAKSWDIVSGIFKPLSSVSKEKDFPRSHYLYYGHIKEAGRILDEVLVSFMKAPRTYTRENIVEINCHGGVVLLGLVLELVLKKGARLAEPGEFTKRAFLNGRIDLVQAESVLNIIQAKTKKALDLAAEHLDGKLSFKIGALRARIIDLLVRIEAVADFPEEDLTETELVLKEMLSGHLKEILADLEAMINGAEQGRIINEGLKTAIIGRPNVGKSSLLNALLREKRAIVTEIPGTTRDLLDEYLNLQGVPLRIIDTAGIQKTRNIVEQEGIKRSKKILREADLVLLVVDAAAGITEEDKIIFALLNDRNDRSDQHVIIVVNKIDCGDCISEKELASYFPAVNLVKTAAIYQRGLEELEKKILDMVFCGKVKSQESILIFNLRQKKRLDAVFSALKYASEAVREGMPLDLVAIDLREALEALSEVTGETVSEEIISKIFENFCIGK